MMRLGKKNKKSKQQFLKDYTLEKKLRENASSTVFKAFHSNFCQVIVKIFEERKLNFRDHQYLMKNQAQILSSLSHENIIRYIQSIQVQGRFVIVSQFCKGGSLRDILNHQEKLSVQEVIRIILGISKGLKYILQKKLIHRNLKPSNIFLQDGIPKIGGFELTCKINCQTFKKLEDLAYQAPEVILNHLYSEKSDIFAIGVIFYQVISGSIPWQGLTKSKLLQKIKYIEAEQNLHCPSQIKKIIFQCLKYEKQERPSIQQLIIILQLFRDKQRKGEARLKENNKFSFYNELRKRSLSKQILSHQKSSSFNRKKLSVHVSRNGEIPQIAKNIEIEIKRRPLRRQGLIPKQPTFKQTLISLDQMAEIHLPHILKKKFRKILDNYFKLMGKKSVQKQNQSDQFLNEKKFLGELIFESSYHTESQFCLIIEGFVRIVYEFLQQTCISSHQKSSLEFFYNHVITLARRQLKKMKNS